MASHGEFKMYYVYLLRGKSRPSATYIGLTDDLRARLESHNSGANVHTSKNKPWHLVTYVAFSSRERAADFERYLKHGSGHAFAHRHLW
jgi:putative endonuclease